MEALIVIAVACVAAVAAWAVRGRTGTPAGSVTDSRDERARAATPVGGRGAGRPIADAAARGAKTERGPRRRSTRRRPRRCGERARRCCAWRSASCSARSRSRRGSPTSPGGSARCRSGCASSSGARPTASAERSARARSTLERVAGHDARAGPAGAAAARSRRRPATRRRASCARSRRRRAARPARRVAQHPRRVHAAPGRRPCGGDDRVPGRAAVRRHEGAHHRPRGAQHPRAREHHGRRLHHRRDAVGGRAVARSTPCGARSRSSTLQKLVQDGRIHPARIEEAYYQAKAEIDNHVMEQGEQALFEANVHAHAPRAGEAARAG